MDGVKSYKLYISMKLHFTDPKFDVFKTKGRLREPSPAKLYLRPDYKLLVALGNKYDEITYIKYLAANFMYGYNQVLYNSTVGLEHYKLYQQRRESMTHVFQNDIEKIIESACFTPQHLLQWVLSGQITLETFRILDDLEGLIDDLKKTPFADLVSVDLLRIAKSRGFVKYDPIKIQPIYLAYKESFSEHGTYNS